MKSKKAKKIHAHFIVSVFGILTLLVLSVFNLVQVFTKDIPKIKTVLAAKSDAEDMKRFWEEELSKSSNYLPGILNLAQIELANGNRDRAHELIQKAKLISPNDDRVKKSEGYFLGSSSGFASPD